MYFEPATNGAGYDAHLAGIFATGEVVGGTPPPAPADVPFDSGEVVGGTPPPAPAPAPPAPKPATYHAS